MSKREQDKERRRAKRIAEVKARLGDIYMGVCGFYSNEDHGDEHFPGYMTLSADQFAGFVGAVRSVFGPGWGETKALIRCDEIQYFDTPDTLATWIVDEEERKAGEAKAEGRQS